MIFSVELKKVTKEFPGVIAVDNVNLEVKRGELFSLLGPSGCGKTTTLRLIGGLETPDEGEVLIGGEVVNDIPAYERDSSIVFQNLALFPHLTLEDNIAFGLERRKAPKQEIKRKVTEIVNLVKLGGMEKRYPDQLSGGQQQRIALARSLILNPEVLLLDEPLASLDRKLRKNMQVELKRIQEEVNTTFIYVTHDQKVALAMSDRVAVMREGKLVQIGAPAEIYERPKTRFIADFMGTDNIFFGKLVIITENKAQVRTENGLEIFAPKDERIQDEGRVEVAVRPESIEVLPKNASWEGDNKFVGKIEEKSYQGDFTEIEIFLANGDKITAHIRSRSSIDLRNLSIGDEVLVGWNYDDSILLVD